jgi:hypothetical protein
MSNMKTLYVGCSLILLRAMHPHGTFPNNPIPLCLGKSLSHAFWKNSETVNLREVLVMDLSSLKMNPKEKVKDFNQRFLTLKN